MTREEEIDKAGMEWFAKVKEYETDVATAFLAGARWADSHPHWISVEDELPQKKSEYDDLSNNVLATDGKEIYESVYNYDFEDWFTHDMWLLDNITHWCYLPQLPILSNSEKTGKNHLIDANNMVDHFADVSKMVEKGGEK